MGSKVSGFKSGGLIIGVVLFIGLLLLIGSTSGSTSIGYGEVGVRFDRFGGGVSEHQYGEGFHPKAPWVSVSKFNTKTQVFTMSGPTESAADQTHAGSVQTTTNEGLYVTLDISIQYKIDATKAWMIYQNVGAEGLYQNTIILPQIRSTIRDVVSQYSAAEVYGEGKAKVETDIFDDLEQKFSPNHIIIESVLLRNVQLPQQLTDAIEAKQAAEQAVLQMQFVLDKEKLEADRKVVEAGGIADANEIIAGSLTDAYLQWYWIQTMQENPKTIYIPIGSDGLPLFKSVE
jgi:regulator of protease activity HflC (stomatin/prohibitin superfamily)